LRALAQPPRAIGGDGCPRYQTGGRLLVERPLARLLRGDWPRTLDESEQRRRPAGAHPAL